MAAFTGFMGLLICVLAGAMVIVRANGMVSGTSKWRRAAASMLPFVSPPMPPELEEKAQMPARGPSTSEKRGAGVLLFAYGRSLELPYFLSEAVAAARTLRAMNPQLHIGIVSNNASVDAALFDTHIRPRADLLFAGDQTNGGQDRADGVPRQWLTRLYYLARSPYEVTWALDANVAACTPKSADSFLRAALATKLWGYDMVHASQRDGALYPHNWNFVYRWTPETAGLLNEWLLLQMHRGVAADDQKTLLVAQTRHRASQRALRVGQIATPLATSFYDAPPPGFVPWYAKKGKMNASVFYRSGHPALSSSRKGSHDPLASTNDVIRYKGREYRADGARITRLLRGTAHMIHTKDTSACGRINAHTSAAAAAPMNPMVADSMGRPIGPTRRLLTRFRHPAANWSDWVVMQSACQHDVGGEACEMLELDGDSDECERALNVSVCPFSRDEHARYLFWSKEVEQRKRAKEARRDEDEWCASHFCLSRWFTPAKTTDDTRAPEEPMVAAAPPTSPPPKMLSQAELQERAFAQIFDADTYASMNVVFQPPYEPLSELTKLERALEGR